MLFNLGAFASAFLISVAFGAAVEGQEYIGTTAQPKGIDVSSHQGTVNWNTVAHNGVSWAYIKATEGTSKGGGMDARCAEG